MITLGVGGWGVGLNDYSLTGGTPKSDYVIFVSPHSCCMPNQLKTLESTETEKL